MEGLMKRILLFLALFCFASGFAQAAEKRESITIFAASSTTDMLTEVIDLYNAQGGKVVASFASSGALARQIESGAPAALFVSANQEWMDYIAEKGLVAEGTRRNWLGNILVLVAPADSKLSYKFADGKKISEVLGKGRFAMGDPAHVPAGQYTQEALEKLGDWGVLEKGALRAGDVRNALMYVSRGEASMGAVFGSDAIADKNVKVLDVFPADSYSSISYPVSLVKGKDSVEAKKFYEFLKTPEVNEIVKKYGFEPK
jgi:molybdate transport system substrate-binding protein